MNARATQAKENLLTRARVSTLAAQEFATLLAGELAKIEARPAPKSAAALERHEATIAGYQAAIAELTQPAPTESTSSEQALVDAPKPAAIKRPTICPAINTRRYFLSHLKEPRGRGSWLFENQAGEIAFMHNGTYGEAKKAALQHCRENGLAGLYTCP